MSEKTTIELNDTDCAIIITNEQEIQLHIPKGDPDDEISPSQLLMFGIAKKMDIDTEFGQEMIDYATKVLQEQIDEEKPEDTNKH